MNVTQVKQTTAPALTSQMEVISPIEKTTTETAMRQLKAMGTKLKTAADLGTVLVSGVHLLNPGIFPGIAYAFGNAYNLATAIEEGNQLKKMADFGLDGMSTLAKLIQLL